MAQYFVDQTLGNDGNDGLSSGAAWKTLSKVNGSTFSAGDTISFKKGETWREELIAPSSGSAGSPITFGAYGSGANPLIKGSDVLSKTWTNLGNAKFVTGHYTGDGTASHAITGLGFQPTLVFVKAKTGSLAGRFKTSAHTGAVSSATDVAADDATTSILSLDADGFTVGSANNANQNTIVFEYIAIADATGSRFEVGTYTGDGSDSRNIVLSGAFQPNFVMVKGAGATEGIWRSTAMAGDFSMGWATVAAAANKIQAFNSNGFQVGTDATVNTNTTKYYYIAWNYPTTVFETGSYVGDGLDNKNIAFGTGAFTPKWVSVKRNASQGFLWTIDDLGADVTTAWGASNTFVDNIQLLSAGGFQVGTGGGVNTSGSTHYYFALGALTGLGGTNQWTAALTSQPSTLFFNGTKGTLAASQAAVDTAGEWFWAANVLTVYSTSDPSTAFVSPGIENVLRTGALINAKSWVKLQNLELTQCLTGILIHGGGDDNTLDTCTVSWCDSNGIYVTDNGTDRPSILNCVAHDTGGYGALCECNDGDNIDGPLISGGEYYNNTGTFNGGAGFARCTNGRVTGVFSHDNFYGIKYVNRAVNCLMDHNIVQDNLDFGCDLDVGGGALDTISGNIVEFNTITGNGSYGIASERAASGTTTNNTARYNLIRNNNGGFISNTSDQDHVYYNVFDDTGPLDMVGATDIEIFNNVFYKLEITHWTDCDGATIKNNIFYELQSGIDDFIEQAASAVNLVSDHNVYFKSSGLGNFRFAGTGVNFAGWQADGLDTHSTFGVDPKMTDPTNHDFTLQGTSPCIDTGVDVGLTQDFNGAAVPSGAGFDIGAFEVQVGGSGASMLTQTIINSLLTMSVRRRIR